MRITIACPKALIPDARHLAMVLGYSAADADTYREPGWQDAQGNRYACASLVCTEGWLESAQGPLTRPTWDVDEAVDMDAAARAQSAVVLADLSDEGVEWRAAPDRILAVPGDDAQAALAGMGLAAVPVEM